MNIRKLSEFIEMIDDYIEEPHSLPGEWVELLTCARELFKEKAGEKLKRIGGYDK